MFDAWVLGGGREGEEGGHENSQDCYYTECFHEIVQPCKYDHYNQITDHCRLPLDYRMH